MEALADHLILAPILLPFGFAVALVALREAALGTRHLVTLVGMAAIAAVAIGLLALADAGGVIYHVGGFPGGYAITLVLDRMSALFLAAAALVGLAAAGYAREDPIGETPNFHALFMAQTIGVNGAFLTGDLFNLYVFFEVTLTASYCLVAQGATDRRLKAGLVYVVLNLVASTLFLVAVGMLYAGLGTLNLAGLARAVALTEPDEAGLVAAGAALAFGVFAAKAALAPLHLYVPVGYAAAPAAVAGLFAILSKVGAYALLRVFPLVFGADLAPAPLAMAARLAPILAAAGVATIVAGAFSALATRRLSGLAAGLLVMSMGILALAVAAGHREAVAAALFYALNSAAASAALFLLAGAVSARRGAAADVIAPAPFTARPGALPLVALGAAFALLGLPPTGGFLAKLMILEALADAPLAGVSFAAILGGSLVGLAACIRAGERVFWAGAAAHGPVRSRGKAHWRALAPGLLVGASLLLAAAAEPVVAYCRLAAAEALDARGYVARVLGPAALDNLGEPRR